MGSIFVHVAFFGILPIVIPAERLSNLVRPVAARLIAEIPPAPPSSSSPQKKKLLFSPAVEPLPVLVASPSMSASVSTFFTTAPQLTEPTIAQPITTVTTAPITIQSAIPVIVARFDVDYLDNPKPVYPNASRRLGEEGKVVLRVRVSAAGIAENVELAYTSGFPRLDQASMEAVSRWRFVPARRGDETIVAWVLVPIIFNLQD